MTVVAFMQNMWVRNPQRIHDNISKVKPSEREDLRSDLIRYCLFAGCLTGRRLKTAFGDDLCEQIIWDEASPKICDNPKEIPPPNFTHIRAVLERHNPDVVIAFGKVACGAVPQVWNGPFVCSPHPACRRNEDLVKLQQAAWHLQFLLKWRPVRKSAMAVKSNGWMLILASFAPEKLLK